MSDEDLDRIRQARIQQLKANLGEAPPEPTKDGAEGTVADLDDASMPGFLKENEVALVDFWAPWCAPCRSVAPVVESVARSWAGKVGVGKLNTDVSRQTANLFGVQSIPTLIVFKHGQPAAKMTGVQPRARFEQVLRDVTGAPTTTRVRRL
jgi:thioredoxin 1